MIHYLRKHLRLYIRYIRLDFRIYRQYRSYLVTSFIQYGTYTIISVVFWQAVFFNVTAIGNWDVSKLVMLSGMMFVGFGLYIHFWGFYNLPGKIRQGDLDLYLSKPINPVAAIIFSEINAGAAISEMTTGLTVVASAAIYYRIPIILANLATGLGLLVLGDLVLVLMQGTISCSAFWLGKTGIIQGMRDLLDDFERFPITLLPSGLRFLLTYIIPMALVSTYPTLIIVGDIEALQTLWIAIIELALLLLWAVAFSKAWHAGIQRYSSLGG